jgi:hypothetical protein
MWGFHELEEYCNTAISTKGMGTRIAQSGVTVARLLCDPLPYIEKCTEVPHGKNLGENPVLDFSAKCTKRSPRFFRLRYSVSGYTYVYKAVEIG